MLVKAVFDAPGSLDEISAETSALLHRAGVQLAVAEAGTDGQIAERLSAGSEGQGVLSHSRVYGTPEDLAVGLQISAAKVDAFGAMSAMVAAEAATGLIDTYEGGWGLVVMLRSGNSVGALGVTSEGPGAEQGVIALGTPGTTVLLECPPNQAVQTALELLRHEAVRRSAQR